MIGDLSGSTPVPGVLTPEGDGTGSGRDVTRRQWATCGGCPARWTRLAIAHCGSCHLTFSTAGNFDKHRSPRGERGACRHPASVGLVERDGVWSMPPPDPTKVDLSSFRAKRSEEPA